MVQRQRLYWILQTGGWLFYATLQVVTSVKVSATTEGNRIVFLLGETFLCFAVTHYFRWLLNRWEWLKLPVPRLIYRVFFSILAMALLVYFLRIPVSMVTGLFDPTVIFNTSKIIGLTSIYSLLFFIWSALYFIFHYVEEYNRSLKYKASTIEIELNNLRSQLNPHFIFNALNSIRALIDENPEKSKQAVNQLSNILRKSLSADNRGLSRFDDELKIVKDYLGLETIRFEERLQTEFIIDPASKKYFVPQLMIQTLVENGIKHGISKLKKGGQIIVQTVEEGGKLKITIRNTGRLDGEKPLQGGLGLKNTRQRLKLIYGEEASFKINNENNTFVRTELIIPLKSYENTDRG